MELDGSVQEQDNALKSLAVALLLFRPASGHWRKENRPAPTCKQRRSIETMFGRIKACGRIATWHNQCAHTRLSAILIAAKCCCWID